MDITDMPGSQMAKIWTLNVAPIKIVGLIIKVKVDLTLLDMSFFLTPPRRRQKELEELLEKTHQDMRINVRIAPCQSTGDCFRWKLRCKPVLGSQ